LRPLANIFATWEFDHFGPNIVWLLEVVLSNAEIDRELRDFVHRIFGQSLFSATSHLAVFMRSKLALASIKRLAGTGQQRE
jgi:hypothetical protein